MTEILTLPGLIDDLITKGDSKFEAIAQVEAVGLQIEKFLGWSTVNRVG